MTFKATGNLSEQIATYLAAQIVRGEMLAGDRIQELRVAGELEVSRGSVREALLLLERRHLIDILPRRGAVVRDLSEAQVRGLYELVQVLLGLVIRKVIRSVRDDDLGVFIEIIHGLQVATADHDVERFFQLSFDFFDAAYPLARNSFVEEVLRDLHGALQRTYFMALHLGDDEMKECLSFFKALIETVFRRDVRSALEIIREFAERQSDLVQESIVRARQIEAAWGGRRR